jgi:glycosyltransferase involved in cell wall biosynthesis
MAARRRIFKRMSKSAKILWISCVGEKGGAEVYMLNLLRHMNRQEFPTAVAMLRPGPLEEDLRALGVPAFVFKAHRMRELWKLAGAIRQLYRLIQREGFDLIHSNGFRAHVYGGVAARLAGVPTVWLGHTAEKQGLSTSAILTIPAAHVIANCPRTAQFFKQHGFRTTMIWPTVDPEQLKLSTPRTDLAARFQLSENARWICMGARLQRYKGQEFFLRALASLPAAMDDVQGVVIGGALFGMEQDYLAELRELAGKLGIANRVRFTGFISDADVRGLLQASELLVHPALDEDFGMIVAEAQALAKPVLAFASVGPAAIVVDGETGRLIPIGDQTGLNQRLAELLAQPELARQWGRAGQLRAVEHFSAEKAVRQLENVYRACLPGR